MAPGRHRHAREVFKSEMSLKIFVDISAVFVEIGTKYRNFYRSLEKIGIGLGAILTPCQNVKREQNMIFCTLLARAYIVKSLIFQRFLRFLLFDQFSVYPLFTKHN